MNKEHTYFVKGMHCASCEVLIEKKLLEIPQVKAVNVSIGNGQATIEYEGEKPSAQALNGIFKKDNYSFFEHKNEVEKSAREHKNENALNPTLLAFVISLFIIIVFLILDRMGIASFLRVSSTSSIIAFFGLGLLAGLSSCGALVGGIVLSMSKQWQGIYDHQQSTYKRFQPHMMFNIGRILSYAVLGGALGLLGSRLQISLGFTSFLVIAVSLLMIGLGLQMLGVGAFNKLQFFAPKFITRNIANERNFKGKYMPFAMGALTFFLPCGFTITAQSLALLSSSATQGFLIMGAFALGTAPMLLFIGFSSVKSFSKQHRAERFSKVAGFLVIFFALFNLTTQMSVLGFSLNNVLAFNFGQGPASAGLAPAVDGKQILKMTVFATHYELNYFKIKAGVPVRWEITSSGEPSCDSGALVANGLLKGPLYLNPNAGQVTTAEFTPQNAGNYKFSCTMGMVRGVIEVVN